MPARWMGLREQPAGDDGFPRFLQHRLRRRRCAVELEPVGLERGRIFAFAGGVKGAEGEEARDQEAPLERAGDRFIDMFGLIKGILPVHLECLAAFRPRRRTVLRECAPEHSRLALAQSNRSASHLPRSQLSSKGPGHACRLSARGERLQSIGGQLGDQALALSREVRRVGLSSAETSPTAESLPLPSRSSAHPSRRRCLRSPMP